ncbi:AAA family ATPase [Paraburkholderia sp. SIMBA_050]|uniref:Cell division protease FtsH n=1 Tax=Paraburkholderia terricola TaxID=169427 RepID=A0ABU1LKN9_9BURK|nr:AAA family ATPase [Paraburkholderia terricola]MDR6407120.1 cell division protease FtsH [Paraburkholderia terricola]MDR6479202.1 cell division protease FtsH [Paraburkholderia terricola]ORC51663.1 cell division protein [Burkholderia sp. A27]
MKPGKNSLGKRRARKLAIAVGAALIAALLAFSFWHHQQRNAQAAPALTGVAQDMRHDPSAWTREEKDASQMMRDVRGANVAAIGVSPNAILVSRRDGSKYFVTDNNAAFSHALLLDEPRSGEAAPYQLVWLPDADIRTGGATWIRVFEQTRDAISVLLPLLLIGGMVWFMRREMRGGAQLLSKAPTLRFDDVIGAGEAKAALADIRGYLSDPKQFTSMGVRAPCGILMVGGPGVGKTRLAQALAGECGASFISITGSYFSAKYYGVGIQKVKNLFELARKNAPTVIFIDEADGLAKRTDTGGGPVEAESNRIINQLLAEMDGFASNEGVIIVAATNHPDNLDEALRRPGRFDRTVQVRLPDREDRAKIFRFYAEKLKSKSADIDYDQLARLTTGLSPATVAMVVNQAGLVARKAGDTEIASKHFMEAIKIARIGDVSGAERALSEDERTRIAVHEAGHGLVAALLGTGVLEEVTILPRGGALGVALITKAQDKHLYRETEIRNEIQVLLGGRNAEILTFSEASSGAASDLQEASRISLDMVSKFGFNSDGDLFSLAALPSQYAGLQMKSAIEHANVLLKELNELCYGLLHAYEPVLRAIADELLEQETVPGETVYRLIREHKNSLKIVHEPAAA